MFLLCSCSCYRSCSCALLACSPACLRKSQHTPTSQRGRGRAKRGPRPIACALGKVFWDDVCGFVLGQLGSNMFKRSCFRGKSGFPFEHVGSNESLDVLVPQICPLVFVDGKLFLSSRRVSFFSLGVFFGSRVWKVSVQTSRYAFS